MLHIVLGLIFIFHHVILFFASILLIIGTKRRDHMKIAVFMSSMIIGISLSFSELMIRTSLIGLSIRLVVIMFVPSIYVYCFYFSWMLYKTFWNEKQLHQKNLGQPKHIVSYVQSPSNYFQPTQTFEREEPVTKLDTNSK